jgi:hypothetical protein
MKDSTLMPGIALFQKSSRGRQFRVVVSSLDPAVALEATRQPAVGPAIGMQHQDYAIGSVQTDRLVNLIEYEGTVELLFRRGEGLGSTGDLDRVWLGNADPLEQLAAGSVEPVIEATHD